MSRADEPTGLSRERIPWRLRRQPDHPPQARQPMSHMRRPRADMSEAQANPACAAFDATPSQTPLVGNARQRLERRSTSPAAIGTETAVCAAYAELNGVRIEGKSENAVNRGLAGLVKIDRLMVTIR